MCSRLMNDHVTLVTMYHDSPERFDTVGVCGAGGCWEKANASGFHSSVQRERRRETDKANPTA